MFFAHYLVLRSWKPFVQRLVALFIFCFVSLAVSSSVFAHTITGDNPRRTRDCLAAIEAYFLHEYGMVLEEELVIHVADSYKGYRSHINEWDVDNKKELARNSLGLTSAGHTILINSSDLSDEKFFFVLAHEMTHKYQFAFWKNPHNDYVQLEGQADVVASQITGYPISIRDHGIKYENLMSREQFHKYAKLYRNETLEQIRFYASQVPFIAMVADDVF